MLLGFENTAERLRDEIALERLRFRRSGRRVACGDSESVDELENEESRECAAEVADAVNLLVVAREIG